MAESVLKNPWVRASGVLAVVVAVLFLAYILTPVLVPLFLAFLVAYVFDPVVDFFENRRIPRTVTIAGFAALGFVLLLAIPLVLVPAIISSAEQMVRDSEVSVDDETIRGRVTQWFNQATDTVSLEEFVRKMGWAEEGGADDGGADDGDASVEGADDENTSEGGDEGANIEDADDEDINVPAILSEKFGEKVKEYVSGLFEGNMGSVAAMGQQAGTTIAQALASIGRGAVGTLLLLGNFALFAFVAGYLLKDFDRLVAGAKKLVPPRHGAKTFDIVGKIDLQVRSFLRGQMTVCLCLGVMYAIGFAIADVPFWFLVAFFGGLACFVPYVGVALTAITALFLTFLGHHALDWHIGVVLATVILAQVLEGNFLTPKIVGDKVGLNPVWVILAVLVFGNFLGFLGLLLAVPMAATLKVLVVEAVEWYKKSPAYTGETGGSGGGEEASSAGGSA